MKLYGEARLLGLYGFVDLAEKEEEEGKLGGCYIGVDVRC